MATPGFKQFSERLRYEPESGLLYWRQDNTRVSAGDVAGCVGSDGYVVVQVMGVPYRAHRIAWLLHTGEWAPQHIDHINGNKADNRITNLRACSTAHNCRNRTRLNKNNRSGVTGVYWSRHIAKWCAQIKVNRERIYLGAYQNLADAAKARADAEQRLYGDYAPTQEEGALR